MRMRAVVVSNQESSWPSTVLALGRGLHRTQSRLNVFTNDSAIPFDSGLRIGVKRGMSPRAIAKSIVETDDANQVTTTTFHDYPTLDGIAYPFSTTSTQGDSAYAQYANVTDVRLMPRLVDRDLRRPVTTRNASIGGALATSIPFDVDAPQGGYIIIIGHIDGSPPLHLIFDTGGSNSLTPEAARRLHLRGIGNVPIGDAGGAQVSSQVVKIRTLGVGAAQLREQSFAIVAMPSTIVDAGRRYRVDGLVGSEILDNFVVSIDRVARALTLTDPKTFHYRGRGVAVPFVSDGQPLIQADLNDVRGLFLFDTGNPSVSEVPRHFVRSRVCRALPGARRRRSVRRSSFIFAWADLLTCGRDSPSFLIIRGLINQEWTPRVSILG
jgi:hypothetical protein